MLKKEECHALMHVRELQDTNGIECEEEHFGKTLGKPSPQSISLVATYRVGPKDLTPEREKNYATAKQPAWLAVLGCYLVSLPFRCQILRPHPVDLEAICLRSVRPSPGRPTLSRFFNIA